MEQHAAAHLRQRAAIHEAGHAVVTLAVGRGAFVNRVEVQDYARALESGVGGVVVTDWLGHVPRRFGERRDRIAVHMGGLEAERRRWHRSILALILTSAGDDYRAAIAIAEPIHSWARGDRDKFEELVGDDINCGRELARDLVVNGGEKARRFGGVMRISA